MVGAVLALLGGWLLWRHKPLAPYPVGAGMILTFLGAVAPRSLKHIYIPWMTLAFVLGAIVSTVVLTLFFYLAVTPLGLLARCLGRDFLDRKWDAQASTYWRRRERSTPRPPADYERQF
jgi:hypothetical protein